MDKLGDVEMMSKNKNAKTQRLPGEYDLNIIECGNPTVRGSLNHYYAVGGNKYGNGVSQAKILKQENGWTLLKNLTVRFSDTDINYIAHDVVGTEDHVWVCDDAVNKDYKVGDNIEFNAKVYAYRRNPDKHNGQISIDFSLKELRNITKIASYNYPPIDMTKNQQEWHEHFIEDLVCNVMCLYSEHCNHTGICLSPDGWKEDAMQMLKEYDNQLEAQAKGV